jgi:hypothetical protein
MLVAHETVYQALYVQGRGELRRELAKALRSGRARRRRQAQQRQPRFASHRAGSAPGPSLDQLAPQDHPRCSPTPSSPRPSKPRTPTPQGSSLIALTCNEIHRLFNAFVTTPTRTYDSACAGRPGDADTTALTNEYPPWPAGIPAYW